MRLNMVEVMDIEIMILKKLITVYNATILSSLVLCEDCCSKFSELHLKSL